MPAPQPVIVPFSYILATSGTTCYLSRVRASKKLDLFAKEKEKEIGGFFVIGISCAMDNHKYNMWRGQATQTSSSPDSAGALIPYSASPLPLRQTCSRQHLADYDDMGSDDCSSDGSRSATPSPNSRYRFPSLAFADAIDIPYKSPVSEPSTTSSYSHLSLSPIMPPSSLSGPAFASCAYPHWPQRDTLSLNSRSYAGTQPNSRIPDEDLLDLAELELIDGMRIAPAMRTEISWEQTRQPPLVLQSLPSVAKKAQPMLKKRRRSSPLKRKKMVLGMSPIAEAPE